VSRVVDLAGGHKATMTLTDEGLSDAELDQILTSFDESGIDLASMTEANASEALRLATLIPRLILLAVLQSWTLTDDAGEPRPITLETLAALRGGARRALREAVQPAVAEVFGELKLMSEGLEGFDPNSDGGS